MPLFDKLVLCVSVTTRERRAGEREGLDYFYTNRQEFLLRVEQGEFIEWAEYAGNLYGTPCAQVTAALARGDDVVLEIELNGARQVRQHQPDAVLVYITAPDLQTLEDRLRGRDTEDNETIAERMSLAREEAQQNKGNGGKPPEFDYVIVNEDAEVAAERLREIIAEIRSQDPMR